MWCLASVRGGSVGLREPVARQREADWLPGGGAVQQTICGETQVSLLPLLEQWLCGRSCGPRWDVLRVVVEARVGVATSPR